jgi:hypothetical protein
VIQLFLQLFMFSGREHRVELPRKSTPWLGRPNLQIKVVPGRSEVAESVSGLQNSNPMRSNKIVPKLAPAMVLQTKFDVGAALQVGQSDPRLIRLSLRFLKINPGDRSDCCMILSAEYSA